MKELSIEEKARAYDKVSKEVKDFFEGRQKMYNDVTKTLEYLFPELSESEDERIRKEIINYFQCQSRDEPTRKDIHNKWIAWLEKQGQQEEPQVYETKVEPKFKVGDLA